jgi:hypothetical protein
MNIRGGDFPSILCREPKPEKRFHHRGHRGHGEQTKKKLSVNKRGIVISIAQAEMLFFVTSVPSVVNLFLAAPEEAGF